MSAQVPNFFNVFIAYNPKNNKVYVADVRTFASTKIWVLDIGLPQGISCPPSTPVAPTYSYSYVSNNFEFDNNGDLWSFSNYNPATGQCSMDKFDVNTGLVINARQVQFPAGNFPTTISSGDLTILPNGRMFATLGSTPSRLYEIINYSSTSSNASAIYLQTLPKDCYGVAYLNGQLQLTGIDFDLSECYYFDYNISANILGTQKPFQVGQAPIDNTSFTPSLGTTKRLVNAAKVNFNTADLTYELYVKNLGNTIINNINVSDDLGATFGVGNVSNVSTAFVSGSNGAGLILNSLYNGVTNTSLLNTGQSLPNQTSSSNEYFFKLTIQCRVTNLNIFSTYLNAAIGNGTIGNVATASLINVSDSSNNGTEAVVDPNNNGNASETGENIPTPFHFGTLPVHFITVNASLLNKHDALIKWSVATPTVNSKTFEVEYSGNGTRWNTIAKLEIIDPAKSLYQVMHTRVPAGVAYYRIRETDNDGAFIYSKIAALHSPINEQVYVITPNPASDYLLVTVTATGNSKTTIEMFDAVGRKMLTQQMQGASGRVNTANIPSGTYLVKVSASGIVDTQKVLIVH
jgi:hypothetical protein